MCLKDVLKMHVTGIKFSDFRIILKHPNENHLAEDTSYKVFLINFIKLKSFVYTPVSSHQYEEILGRNPALYHSM